MIKSVYISALRDGSYSRTVFGKTEMYGKWDVVVHSTTRSSPEEQTPRVPAVGFRLTALGVSPALVQQDQPAACSGGR